MKLLVSTKNNNIYADNINSNIRCWSEYKMNFDNIKIQNIKLISKMGGKSGNFQA